MAEAVEWKDKDAITAEKLNQMQQVQGPKGDKGDKGETGAKGATGAAGKDGKVQSLSSVAPDENGDIDLAKVLDQQDVKTKLSSIIQAEIAKPAE